MIAFSNAKGQPITQVRLEVDTPCEDFTLQRGLKSNESSCTSSKYQECMYQEFEWGYCFSDDELSNKFVSSGVQIPKNLLELYDYSDITQVIETVNSKMFKKENLDAKNQYFLKLWAQPAKSFKSSCTELGLRRKDLADFEGKLQYYMD